MQQIRMIEYGSTEYDQMVQLRDELLRKPLGLHFTPAYLAQEINDILIGCFDDTGNITGCCILSPIDEETARLRQMAVRKDLQGSGVGRAILEYAETAALEHHFKVIMIHARKTAMPFYERFGYRLNGDEFLEVSIPHFEMRKELDKG
jgi:predicted GNAT family N-acyltransferase